MYIKTNKTTTPVAEAIETTSTAVAVPEVEAEEAPVVEEVQEEPAVSFEVWWMTTTKKAGKKIPLWTKEIIRADFKARNLKSVDTMSNFDKALIAYGIKL
jgi:hypothetical protein